MSAQATASSPITIKPGISLSEATRRLKGPLRELKRGRLAMVVDFFIPYRLFQVIVSNANHSVTKLVALDVVTGSLDPFVFEEMPERDDTGFGSPPRICAAAISEARALEIILEKTKRDLYLRGFFRVRDPQLSAKYCDVLHVPYWVGIYRRGDGVKIEALNAITGLYEGAKIREIITDWFESRGTPR